MQPPHCLPSVDQLDLGLEEKEGGREGGRERGRRDCYEHVYIGKTQLHI